MFERFTDRARKVTALANQVAQTYQHEYIGTEHILAGIIREGSGAAPAVLRNLGVFDRVDADLKRLLTKGDIVAVGKNPQTPRARKAIEHAIEASREIGDNYLGTEHLLLGLIREEGGVAAQVLINNGVTFDVARDEIVAMRGAEPENSLALDALRSLLAQQEREVAETKTAIAVLEKMKETPNAD